MWLTLRSFFTQSLCIVSLPAFLMKDNLAQHKNQLKSVENQMPPPNFIPKKLKDTSGQAGSPPMKTHKEIMNLQWRILYRTPKQRLLNHAAYLARSAPWQHVELEILHFGFERYGTLLIFVCSTISRKTHTRRGCQSCWKFGSRKIKDGRVDFGDGKAIINGVSVKTHCTFGLELLANARLASFHWHSTFHAWHHLSKNVFTAVRELFVEKQDSTTHLTCPMKKSFFKFVLTYMQKQCKLWQHSWTKHLWLAL